ELARPHAVRADGRGRGGGRLVPGLALGAALTTEPERGLEVRRNAPRAPARGVDVDPVRARVEAEAAVGGVHRVPAMGPHAPEVLDPGPDREPLRRPRRRGELECRPPDE